MKKLNLQNIKNILLIGMLVVIFGFMYSFRQQSNTIATQNININSLTDTIRVTSDRYNNALYSKNILLLDYDGLKKVNAELAREVKRGSQTNLAEITQLQIVIDNLTDSLKKTNGLLIKQDSNLYVYEFKDSTEFRYFQSQVAVVTNHRPDSVQLQVIKDQIFADIIIKKYIEKDKITLQVYSHNPNLSLNTIEGSIIDISKYTKIAPKKKFSVGIGPQIGIGYVSTLVKPQSDGIGWYVGIGVNVQYNFINF